MIMPRAARGLLALLSFLVLLTQAEGQTLGTAEGGGSLPDAPNATAETVNSGYQRPTEKTKLHNYLFDAFGPYPIVGSAFAAGVNQAYNDPPEWRQGAEGYGKRFGSHFGIAAISTTSRYTLAEAFHEDTLYYRCECKGLLPRFAHAMLSTLTSRRGDDGHRVFSFASLVSPYVGTFAGTYAWFPDRFGAKDAFRMGNYGLLYQAAGNVGLEFLYAGPHKWLSRFHLENPNLGPSPGTKQ